jgi:selT/selW/selH-like putative selenoprotein
VLEQNGIDVTTTPGGSGQFDVLRDGEVVFSKKQEHRFPGEREILAAIA